MRVMKRRQSEQIILQGMFFCSAILVNNVVVLHFYHRLQKVSIVSTWIASLPLPHIQYMSAHIFTQHTRKCRFLSHHWGLSCICKPIIYLADKPKSIWEFITGGWWNVKKMWLRAHTRLRFDIRSSDEVQRCQHIK